MILIKLKCEQYRPTLQLTKTFFNVQLTGTVHFMKASEISKIIHGIFPMLIEK